MNDKDLQADIEHICRGAEDVIPMEEMIAKLRRSRESGTPLRIKYGIDPSGPHVHLGHTVPLRIFRRFQEAGHQGVLIIGGYTAMVGDPSGKSEMRPQLTAEQVDVNAGLYLKQVGKVIDIDKAEICNNGDWFASMTFAEILKLCSRMTVAQLLERDDFNQRFKNQTPISMHEFLYPLMQGWDSVMVRADVELGGTEQLFNLNVGRQLQKEEGQEPQVCVTVPILVGTDGVRRMGKSIGNYIGIEEDPKEMFGKIMSIPDAVMPDFYKLLTELPESEHVNLHPREAKVRLAKAIIEQYHDRASAEEAEQNWDRVFKEQQLPEDMPELKVPSTDLEDGAIWIVKLIVMAGFAKSNGEARRHVQGRGVSLNQEKVTDITNVKVQTGDVLQVGKRKFCQIVVV